MCLAITWAKYNLTHLTNLNKLGETRLKLSGKYGFFIFVYSDLSYNKGKNNIRDTLSIDMNG